MTKVCLKEKWWRWLGGSGRWRHAVLILASPVGFDIEDAAAWDMVSGKKPNSTSSMALYLFHKFHNFWQVLRCCRCLYGSLSLMCGGLRGDGKRRAEFRHWNRTTESLSQSHRMPRVLYICFYQCTQPRMRVSEYSICLFPPVIWVILLAWNGMKTLALKWGRREIWWESAIISIEAVLRFCFPPGTIVGEMWEMWERTNSLQYGRRAQQMKTAFSSAHFRVGRP
jgi:hypothetical protein